MAKPYVLAAQRGGPVERVGAPPTRTRYKFLVHAVRAGEAVTLCGVESTDLARGVWPQRWPRRQKKHYCLVCDVELRR